MTTGDESTYNLYLNGNQLCFNIKKTSNKVPQDQKIITKNFPLQKWTNVFVNVKQNTYAFFINGKLEQTYINSSDETGRAGIGTIKAGPCKGDIYITNLQRWDYTRDAATIWNKYLNGLGFSLPTYNATLTYKEDNKIIQQNSLFSNPYK